MVTVVIMPRQGNTVESCIIAGWKKSEENQVSEGEVLCEAELGQSIWYDNVQRSLLLNGEIAGKINEESLTETLQEQGVASFADSFRALLKTLDAKRGQMYR